MILNQVLYIKLSPETNSTISEKTIKNNVNKEIIEEVLEYFGKQSAYNVIYNEVKTTTTTITESEDKTGEEENTIAKEENAEAKEVTNTESKEGANTEGKNTVKKEAKNKSKNSNENIGTINELEFDVFCKNVMVKK